jgi:hypothetical protein
MNRNTTLKDFDLWERLVHAHLRGSYEEFTALLKDFLAERVNRVPLLRQALHGNDKGTAIYVLPRLPADDLRELFEELVWIASFSHGAVHIVRAAILSLPRDWVLQNIEGVVEPILVSGTYDEYRRILELYATLSRDLALKLARRALAQDDIDIQEAGQDFVKRLGEK